MTYYAAHYQNANKNCTREVNKKYRLARTIVAYRTKKERDEALTESTHDKPIEKIKRVQCDLWEVRAAKKTLEYQEMLMNEEENAT